MLADLSVSSLGWNEVLVVGQTLLSLLLGLIIWLAKRQIAQGDARIELQQQQIDAISREAQERELRTQRDLNEIRETFIPRAQCQVIEDQRREDLIRLFAKVDDVGREQARMEGKMSGQLGVIVELLKKGREE
jgi:hypothetical protein